MDGLIARIRRRETELDKRLYSAAKWVMGLNMPVVRPLHVALRVERGVRRTLWERAWSFMYYEPMFKTLCASCGRHLRLFGGIPQVYGDLVMLVGDNVTMHGVSTFIGAKTVAKPTLAIGDSTYLGYQMEISVGRSVTIGRHVLIANRVALLGYDHHPLDPIARAKNLPPDASGAGDIVIEDFAWLGTKCLVLKNVRIGEGAVVGAGSVVTKDIPPYTLAVGTPARVVKSLEEFRPAP
jgi:acetyltransferase-like isoleucine patch superfamily enzyme